VIAAAAALALLALTGAWVLSRSEAILRARHPLPPSLVTAASTPQAREAGAHLALVTACNGCHGADLTGGPLSVWGTEYDAPNLTLLARRRSDAELDRAIRGGLRPYGSSELIMPAQAYARLTDAEVAAIISYLRSLPPRGAQTPRPRPGLLLRASLATALLRTSADQLARARPPLAAPPGLEAGRHLAEVACARCHGADLGGVRGGGPDLTVRGYYNRAEFFGLMRRGDLVSEGDMELMNQTARASFSHFTDAEIDAIYAYLDARDRVLAARASQQKGP
jgi:mono/diheme cytochrome c family protein